MTNREQGASMTRAVQELTSEMSGRWLVTTQGSQHVWDLDKMTYQRLPGEGRQRFPYDEQEVPVARVGAFPRVGEMSMVWYDDPTVPEILERWLQSSRIVSIKEIS